MDFVDRIDEILEKKNLKRSAMCQDLNINHAALTAWKKRGTIPAGDVCLRIADYLGVSAEWLISGREGARDDRERVTAEERTLLDELRALAPAQREHIELSLGVFAEQNRRAGEKKAGKA